MEVGKNPITKKKVLLNYLAAKAFLNMQKTALKEGLKIVPISGLRTKEYQKLLFENAKKKYGEDAKLVVAPPGESEHETGFAIDLGDGDNHSTHLEKSFAKTKVYKWLLDNAYKFGFELSYPEGNKIRDFEPWHWRYKQ